MFKSKKSKWPKLSQTQLEILEAIEFGSRIVIADGEATLVDEHGNSETIRYDSFRKLLNLELIKLKKIKSDGAGSDDVEWYE